MARIRFFPHQAWESRFRGWLYLVEYADNRIKIGMTLCPQQRGANYLRGSGAVDVRRMHLFGAMPKNLTPIAERLAINVASGIGRRLGRTETFADLTWADALATVRMAMRVVADDAEPRMQIAPKRRQKTTTQKAED